jgi:hypothetical protein
MVTGACALLPALVHASGGSAVQAVFGIPAAARAIFG